MQAKPVGEAEGDGEDGSAAQKPHVVKYHHASEPSKESAVTLLQRCVRGRSAKLELAVRLALRRADPGSVAAARASRGLDAWAAVVHQLLGPAAWVRALHNAPDRWEESDMMAAMDSVLTDPANSALVWLLARPTACERAVLSLGGPAQAAQDPAKAARAAAAAVLTAAREEQGASQQQCRPHAETSAAAAALQAPHRRRTGRGEVDRRRRYAAESSCQEDSTTVTMIQAHWRGRNGRTEADRRRSAWLAEEFAAQDEKSATRLQARHRGRCHRGRLVGASVEHQRSGGSATVCIGRRNGRD